MLLRCKSDLLSILHSLGSFESNSFVGTVFLFENIFFNSSKRPNKRSQHESLWALTYTYMDRLANLQHHLLTAVFLGLNFPNKLSWCILILFIVGALPITNNEPRWVKS